MVGFVGSEMASNILCNIEHFRGESLSSWSYNSAICSTVYVELPRKLARVIR